LTTHGNIRYAKNCRKNSHEEVEMVREVIEVNGKKEEFWVCPVCGATKKL
jgi:rubrerythrin